MKSLVLTLILLSLAVVASAAELVDRPLFSPTRLSLAVGGDYAFYSGANAPKFPVKKEWQAGVFAAYKLTPTLSLVAASRYGVDSKQFDSKVGLRLLVWSGDK